MSGIYKALHRVQPKKWMDNVKEDLATQGMNIREAVDNST